MYFCWVSITRAVCAKRGAAVNGATKRDAKVHRKKSVEEVMFGGDVMCVCGKSNYDAATRAAQTLRLLVRLVHTQKGIRIWVGADDFVRVCAGCWWMLMIWYAYVVSHHWHRHTLSLNTLPLSYIYVFQHIVIVCISDEDDANTYQQGSTRAQPSAAVYVLAFVSFAGDTTEMHLSFHFWASNHLNRSRNAISHINRTSIRFSSEKRTPQYSMYFPRNGTLPIPCALHKVEMTIL